MSPNSLDLEQQSPQPNPEIHWENGQIAGFSADDALRRRLGAVAERLDALAAETAALWLAHGPDRECGGFHGRLSRTWMPVPPTDKGGIQHGRHLWTWSMWFERRGGDERSAFAAKSAYRFLRGHLFDSKDGEYCASCTRDGLLRDTNKTIYGQAFAIYGLSRFGIVFADAGAKQAALDCFEAVDRRAHDHVYGGYDQTGEHSWITAGAAKETNTHIHMMEALTELYLATRETSVRERLSELVRLCVEKLLQQSGYCHLDFARGWSPFGAPIVSFGHDLETAWLLLHAERALGCLRPEVARGAAVMAQYSSESGFDSSVGGYFSDGVPGAALRDREKVWWTQFEALSGLWWAYRLTGDVVHVDRLIATLDWIETGQRDAEFREWYWGVLPGGAVGPRGAHKGELWKAAYHNLRALVFLRDWLRDVGIP